MTKFKVVCLHIEHDAGGKFQIVLPEFFCNMKKRYLENNTHMYAIQCFSILTKKEYILGPSKKI